MANILLSPNMSLPVPVVGQEAGPQFATDVNSSLTIIDQHNHTSGSGVQIPTAGLNINADLSFNSNNLTQIRSSRYASQTSPLALATDLDCVYVSGVDLYYNDGNGNQVRLTQSGAVAGSPGSIANLVSPASASYNSVGSTFVWQSGANTPANMDGASYILRNLTANSKGLTLAPPNAMAADYSIVLPTLPSSLSFLTIDSSGNMGTLVQAGGITGSMIAAATIQGSNVAAATITGGAGGNLAAATIDTTNIANNINLPGSPQGNGKYLVLNFSNITGTNLAVMRGIVNSAGTVLFGEGFTVAHPSTGTYTISFTSAFGDTPAVNITPRNTAGAVQNNAVLGAQSTIAFNMFIFNIAGTLIDADFNFMAIGVRN